MIPKNNKEEFIKRYGNWWYLREFDFFPQNLADYEQNMTTERMEIALSFKKPWAIYGNYHDAVQASIEVRQKLGLPQLDHYPSEDIMTYPEEVLYK